MPTPAGYADISLKFVLDSFIRPSYVTFGVNPTDTDPDLVAGEVLATCFLAGSLNSQLDSNVRITECVARLGTDGAEDLIGLATSTAVGGRTGGSVPPNVAVLVHKRTARGGRRGRGRFYLPWYCSDNDTNEDGTLLAAAVTAMQNAVIKWNSDLVASGNPMVILHSPGRTTAGPPDPVTGIVVSNVVATQRRRLGR
jgi:hypothetical protein